MTYSFRVEDMDALRDKTPDTIKNRQLRSWCGIFEGQIMFIVSNPDGFDCIIERSEDKARRQCRLLNTHRKETK